MENNPLFESNKTKFVFDYKHLGMIVLLVPGFVVGGFFVGGSVGVTT